MRGPKHRPVLKWAGGKTQLLEQIVPLFPETIETYYEPFLGGAAVFFALARQGRFKRAVLSDLNPDLVFVYQTIQAGVERLIERLSDMQRQHSEAFYYRVRATNPKSPLARAARLIYLNKTGYNGLYRVNSKGVFNVPFGNYKNPTICDEENLREAGRLLQSAEIRKLDFEAACRTAALGDAVYLDPPYVPVSKTASFTSYQSGNFSMNEQRRLSSTFRELATRKISAILSNSYTPETEALYHGFRLRKVLARRSINRNGEGRGQVAELLVCSWEAVPPARGVTKTKRKARRVS